MMVARFTGQPCSFFPISGSKLLRNKVCGPISTNLRYRNPNITFTNLFKHQGCQIPATGLPDLSFLWHWKMRLQQPCCLNLATQLFESGNPVVGIWQPCCWNLASLIVEQICKGGIWIYMPQIGGDGAKKFIPKTTRPET